MYQLPVPDNNNTPTAEEPDNRPYVLVYAPRAKFLQPYFEREFSDYRLIFSAEDAIDALVADGPIAGAVMVSSTDIYNVTAGELLTEDTPLDLGSVWSAREKTFSDFCNNLSINGVTLRCANTVGTGMNGFAMRLARGIARGTMMHIKGNEGLISVVHAVDVARYGHLFLQAINENLTDSTVFNITDGVETPVDELINALAFRIKNKDVFTLKSTRLAKILYGNELYSDLTRRLTFSNALAQTIAAHFGMSPHIVTDYLRTHVYDESSL